MLLFPPKGRLGVLAPFQRLCRAALVVALAPGFVHALQLSSLSTGDTGELSGAKAALDSHRWVLADGLLRAFLAQHQDAYDAMYLLALALFHQDRPRDSLAMYTQAAKGMIPGAQDFRYIALDYVLLHDYTDADKWITRSAHQDPTDGETWYAMGRIKYTENRFQESVDSFRQALALMPRSVKAENNLGLALEGLNHPEEAIRVYRQAIAWQAGDEHPSEQPLLNLGVLLADRNALDEALPLLQKAEALAPTDGKIHAALGKLYARQLALPEAQKEFEQAVTAEPKDAALHFQLGQVYRKEGLQAQAKEELARAAALDGTHSSDGGGTQE